AFMAIFTCNSYALISEYNEEEYEVQKALLNEKYIFQSEEMGAFDTVCEHTAVVDGYFFRTLSVEGEYKYINYPKNMFLIGTNDQTKEIVYMYFNDIDLDYISSLEDFINDDCGFEHMR
ncbi:MAG: hypothetical protein IJX55_08900, partial [Clostridia bacterium]|nr:hypothetical protein [Clostridia bacterium]